MSLRLILTLFVWFTLIGQSHMDSGDGSGELDDSDFAYAKLVQRKLKLVTVALNYITRNASDFHYIARDDHEVIHNMERELRRKSRKRGAKLCWRKCERTLKCFQELATRPKSKKGKCNVCIAKCSTTTLAPTKNAGR